MRRSSPGVRGCSVPAHLPLEPRPLLAEDALLIFSGSRPFSPPPWPRKQCHVVHLSWACRHALKAWMEERQAAFWCCKCYGVVHPPMGLCHGPLDGRWRASKARAGEAGSTFSHQACSAHSGLQQPGTCLVAKGPPHRCHEGRVQKNVINGVVQIICSKGTPHCPSQHVACTPGRPS